MIRALGVGLVVALALASGPAARQPLTTGEYISFVRASTTGLDDQRLFDDVVNYSYYPQVLRRVGRSDQTTLVGDEWLRSERLLRREIDALTERFGPLLPPADVASLHAAWMSALRGCAAALRDLESSQEQSASGDFDRVVAERVRLSCFDRFDSVIPVFEAKGYVFSQAS